MKKLIAMLAFCLVAARPAAAQMGRGAGRGNRAMQGSGSCQRMGQGSGQNQCQNRCGQCPRGAQQNQNAPAQPAPQNQK